MEPKTITVEDINKNILQAEYAVRGRMVQRAGEIEKEMKEGKKFPFDELNQCNIGNPQVLGQPPITFYRQVLACLMSSDVLNSDIFPKGVYTRAKSYLSGIKGNIGAYSASPGYQFVRDHVAQYIEKRDGIKADADKVILTDGASQGISMVLNMLIADHECGIMIPLPQYPLYSAAITLFGGRIVPYYLDEESGWQIKLEDVKQAYDDAIKKGTKIRAICVINPGNPTGQILTADTLKDINKFAYERGLMVLADEVYQENIWSDTKKFVSMRKATLESQSPYNKTTVFSFMSVSKGFYGECGMRGGYTEYINLNPKIEAQLKKYKTISLCSSTVGQIFVDLVVNPPTLEENGEKVVEVFTKERNEILAAMKRRAKMATDAFNSMTNVSCQPSEGALYCFPNIKLSDTAIEEAKRRGIAPDLLYTLDALEATGVVTVQGTGFGQKPGTYHLRGTILIRPDEKFQQKLEEFKKFNEEFHKKYPSSKGNL